MCNQYARFLRHQITDFKRAQEYYRRAIAMDPGNYNYHLNYFVLLLNNLRDYVTAKRELKILLFMRPNDPVIRRNYDKPMERNSTRMEFQEVHSRQTEGMTAEIRDNFC